MHGRKKQSTPTSDVEKDVLQKKATLFQKLSTAILTVRNKLDSHLKAKHDSFQDCDDNKTSLNFDELLTMSENICKSNPDFYSVWNIRRELLILKHDLPNFMCSKSREDKLVNNDLVQLELDLTAAAIRKNSKSCNFV